ncbi:MAG TPA: AMP-binding protein [Alphaproteobacteria bacterium]|nr:AMP-binding protein [Alphaproteobacteria bacterium]
MQSVYDFIRLSATRAPHHPAMVDDRSDRSLSHAQLVEEVDRIAAGLVRQGIAHGDLVATCLPNLYEHGLALLALERLGAVPALVNPRLKPADIASLIAQGGMKAAIVAADPGLVAAMRTALAKDAPIITVGGSTDGTPDFTDCTADPADLPAYRRPGPEDTAFVFYTSGTTGLPKGVQLPHRATDARFVYLPIQCGLVHGTHNKAIGLMPLFHVVGFYSVFLSVIGIDGTYFVASAFDPAAAVELIVREGITLLYATPTHFHALLAAPNFAPEKMASVKNLIYAGAAMPGPLLDRVGDAFNAKMINIYGTTEVMNGLYMADPVGRPHTYRPGFGSNVRVGRFGGTVHDEAALGEDGELLVDAAADATFTGYLNRPEATAEKMTEGWYRTGDIAVRRADGDLDVKGRVDDMIISGGENIYPEEVEAALLTHDSVAECSVVGAPDEKWGEIVVACITPNGAQPEDALLDAHLRAGALADFKRPRAYLFLDDLPKNAAGKVLRRILRETAMQNIEPA